MDLQYNATALHLLFKTQHKKHLDPRYTQFDKTNHFKNRNWRQGPSPTPFPLLWPNFRLLLLIWMTITT